jgi:predicted transcriptional regulator
MNTIKENKNSGFYEIATKLKMDLRQVISYCKELLGEGLIKIVEDDSKDKES